MNIKTPVVMSEKPSAPDVHNTCVVATRVAYFSGVTLYLSDGGSSPKGVSFEGDTSRMCLFYHGGFLHVIADEEYRIFDDNLSLIQTEPFLFAGRPESLQRSGRYLCGAYRSSQFYTIYEFINGTFTKIGDNAVSKELDICHSNGSLYCHEQTDASNIKHVYKLDVNNNLRCTIYLYGTVSIDRNPIVSVTEDENGLVQVRRSIWVMQAGFTKLSGQHISDARYSRQIQWCTKTERYELLSDDEKTRELGDGDAIILPPTPQQIKKLHATLIPLFETTGLLADLIFIVAKMCAY
jgi:hypothetical protein